MLSRNYSGDNFKSTYCYDVLKQKEVRKNVVLKPKDSDLEEPYGFSTQIAENISQRLDRILKIANKIQTDREIGKITEKAVSKVFAKHEGKPVDMQMINELSEELAIAYVKFSNRGRKNML